MNPLYLALFAMLWWSKPDAMPVQLKRATYDNGGLTRALFLYPVTDITDQVANYQDGEGVDGGR